MRGAGPWLFVLVALASPPLRAAPAATEPDDHDAVHVIPGGQEDRIRALIDPVQTQTPAGWSWRGPQIEIDRVKWWLLHEGEARAMLVLLPQSSAATEDPVSESFAVRVTWPPRAQPNEIEVELLAAAVESVRARDEGGFYQVALDNVVDFGDIEDTRSMPYDPPADAGSDPEGVRRRWALELAGLSLLGLFGLGVSVRRFNDAPTTTTTPSPPEAQRE